MESSVATGDASAAANSDAALRASEALAPLSTPARHMYVHVPFCARRCSYCDFSIAVRNVVPVDRYIAALAAEMDSYNTAAVELDTLYLGGGTPSRLGGEGVAGVISLVRSRTMMAPDAEITIEANPDDVTAASARAWRAAGVNRVSLGAQSFDEGVLEWMHRAHSATQIGDAVRLLKDSGIDNISVDLIFALPPEISRDWSADLDRALALEPRHISLYGLTVEAHTPLARWRERGSVTDAPEESYETEFMLAHERLVAAGLDHYEVSNFGQPGFRSRHNSAYWSGVPYIGLGPSAHGFDIRTRQWNVAAYAQWERLLASGQSAIGGLEVLTPANRAAERVYLGLRTDAGLTATDAELDIVRPWLTQGWAILRDGAIVLTPSGLLRLDALAAFLTHAGSL
ncbi:MAG: radical SAM family heme chaperone HemW [Gemmatimonadaceae bacterium]